MVCPVCKRMNCVCAAGIITATGPVDLSGLRASPVSHPPHYNSGKIEVIEAIEDWKLPYNLGNTVKYIARAGRKDPSKEIEDLEKGAWYLQRQIELLKAQKKGVDVVRPNDMVKR